MFNENLVNLIKDKFHECLKEGISFQPAYYPNIQKKQEEKARKHFIETERDDETVLMLFDTSLFSKGKNGLALTDQAIYFKDLMGPTWRCAYTGWRIDADDAEVLLHISDKNTFLLAPFVTKLMNEICTLKKYEGLFEAEGAEQKAAEEAAKKAEEQKAAEETAKKAAEEAAKKSAEEEEAEKKDEDEDDDDDVGLLDLLGVVMDVTSDPSRE
ncbi:MAG: hypothetical protein K5897_01530, partial [Eubacterium sp.]|nr:hypothetical protein [Eubacterium sp.]